MWKMFREKGEHQFLKNPVPFLEMRGEWPCSVDEKIPLDVIDTESNLNSKVLKRLTATLGVDYSGFESKEKLIDDHLLNTRNRIAHGERITVNAEDYEEVDVEIRDLIDRFQTLIEDCIQTESYRL